MSPRKPSDEEDEDEEEPSLIASAVKWWDRRSAGEKAALQFGAVLLGKAALEGLRDAYAEPPQPVPPRAASSAPPPGFNVDEIMRHNDALLLGCSPFPSTDAEVRKAFKIKAREVHPDKPGGNTEAMKVINLAYERHLARVKSG